MASGCSPSIQRNLTGTGSVFWTAKTMTKAIPAKAKIAPHAIPVDSERGRRLALVGLGREVSLNFQRVLMLVGHRVDPM